MEIPKRFGLIVLIFIVAIIQNSAAQNYPKGLDFNDSTYALTPKKARLLRGLDTVPASVSLKDFAPYPKSQGDFLTCTAWACAYCALTMTDAIKNHWTNKDSITAKAYSPAFLFRMTSPADNICASTSQMEIALGIMKNKGSIHYAEMPLLCVPQLSSDQIGKASNAKLKDYARLFDVSSSAKIKIQAVKKALFEKKPVVIGMICPPSFYHAYHDWTPTEQPLTSFGGHAMCVVGYDDTQFGGSFEVQNSWGENWGFEGYTWIHYADFANFVRYGYEFIDVPASKPDSADLSGSVKIMLSDARPMPVSLRRLTRGLKIVSAQTETSPLTVYQTADAYTSGTNFRIYISNDQPAYVYAISVDDENKVFKVFPDKDGISAALTYKKNDLAIPNEDEYIQFGGVPGKDFLCVLYSKNELNINDIIAKIAAADGTFDQKVYKVTGDRMVDPANIKFTDNKIAFQGFSKGKDIVAMMIELDHK